MKNLILIFITLLTIQISAYTQPCLPNGIIFVSQEQINNFQNNYPGCTEIEGYVWIDGNDIVDLNGLNVITKIYGELKIQGNDVLTSLLGLDNLTSVGGDLYIKWNFILPDLTGLGGLISVGANVSIGNNVSLKHLNGLYNLSTIMGGLSISSLDSLVNLSGLNSLYSIGDDLWIYGNHLLSDFEGIDDLHSIGGGMTISGNFVLESISNLSNLTSIGGHLHITHNYFLSTLVGLDNINENSINELVIIFNDQLTTCEVESICNYLANPNGTFEIHDNATGCFNHIQVIEACEATFIDEKIDDLAFTISPNPCSGSVKIQFTIYDDDIAIFELFDISGVMIKRIMNEPKKPGTYNMEFDMSDLPAGVYIIKLQTNNNIKMKKIIKR